MGIFEFLLAIIVFFTAGSVGLAFLAGRAAWRGGKRLLGWARDQKQLTDGSGGPKPPSQEAADVVIEAVDEDEEPVAAGPRVRKTNQRAAYVRLDVDAGTTADDISAVLRRYKLDRVLGERAQAVTDTLESAELRRQTLEAELDATFQQSSLSWEKFAAPIHAAFDAILRSSALLANRIQGFDSAGYQRLLKSVQQDQLGPVKTGAKSRAERLALYQEMLASLDTLQETNEGLLLELDKLASELRTLQHSGGDADDAVLEEIRRLVAEAKYYRNN